MNNLSLHQETCQPKRAGPYEQPVQDNIKKKKKKRHSVQEKGSDPEIHLQKRKDPEPIRGW